MCVSSAPATFSSTVAMAARVNRDGFRVHMLAYQNRAESLNSSGGANCMILHIPSAAPLTRENVINTTGDPNFLKRIDRALQPVSMLKGSATRGAPMAFSKSIDVFDVGSYTVVLARRALPEDIHKALQTVPANKRPVISHQLLEWYVREFKDHSLAFCCFDGKITPEPLLFWYNPIDPTSLFCPGWDSHDGTPPVPGPVARDHTLIFGDATQGPDGAGMQVHRVTSTVPAINELIPRVASRKVVFTGQNGDFRMNLATGTITSGSKEI